MGYFRDKLYEKGIEADVTVNTANPKVAIGSGVDTAICTDDILYGLGTGYVGGGELTQNIEKMGGEGTAEFIFQAIKIYCGK